MKSRSHYQRPLTMDPPDWVNGSWTVDCVCGVNFDDGEEMVDCDECGVWVHTRCSRYVKSEKSFTCDKCKNRSSGNECEETEMAQLLVDLPSNTLRMDSNHSLFPPRYPIRLWTQRPIEERVHVQGVPGGEPSLFGGLSSIFTPELWKCTGNVPKKFNFKYREFPCWGEDESKEENENPVDKGAGVLFSLSKHVLVTPVVNTLFHKEGRVVGDRCERVAALDDLRKSEGGKIKIISEEKDIQNDDALPWPLVFRSGKRKKEDLGTPKGQSVKKKLRLVHKERDSKNRATVTSMTTFTSPSEAKQLFFHEARGSKIIHADDQDAKSSDMHTVQSDPFSGDEDVVKNNVDKSNDNIASSVKPQENNDFDVSRQSMLTEAGPKEEKACHKVYTKTKGPTNAENEATSSRKKDYHVISLKEEAVGSGPNNLNDNEMSPKGTEDDPKKSEPFVRKPLSPILEVTDSENCSERPPGHMGKVKTEIGVDNLASVEFSTLSDVKIEGTKAYVLHVESTPADNRTITSLKPTVLEAQVDDTSEDAVGNCQTDAVERFQSEFSQPIHQDVGSERSASDGKSSNDFKHKIRVSNGHPSKVTGKNTIPQAPSSQHKVTDNRRISESTTRNSKTGISNSNSDLKNEKDGQERSIKRDKEVNEIPNNILREHLKSSLGFALKNSLSGKVSPACEAKRISSDLKYSTGGSSCKTPSAQNNEVPSASNEPANPLENQNVSHVRSRNLSPGSSLRGEKSCHSNSNSLPMHLPAQSSTSAVLSDEELALLLHQELNSSPRVPRVPRMRNAGSGSQLGSPTGTTTLMRTTSSGSRDQSVTAKRKGKDSPKRRSHSSRDTDDETNDGLLLLPDRRNNKPSCSVEGLPKREGGNARKWPHNVKKSANPLSTTTVSSKPFSPSGVCDSKSGSTRHSLRNPSDDDVVSIKGSAHQTLPGLLAEIMGKGKRMTYEELCNAVLPHWPHLRKHNGERYAYSTHSQAVLDCLRNRQEWAQLVDRGPKTNGCRKKRKHEIDTPSNESEDDEYGNDASSKEIESRSLKSHQDDVPKGKRKARKRPRLPLQRRRIKDVKRQNMTESDEGDNNGSSSSSSEDSMCSNDEMHGNDTCENESETSSSSDEEGTSS